ncbi:cation:dicarboxylase symporter family transporter [Saccharopolyspora hirsuta]|uniref:Cation:dicarboxylase symporter family transporter n=1 Tax=Saccharopolyspora hirsuta TaxID=1837 RepID=A0A5M7BMM0_SACHI|nr:cation:dicarboxylase symporter family transporter [Saccharopolyspora hirsuta]KAA5830553.1 cation:dicarboxylase symporter family transporter [Saccharopolyspora hirsuta]
MRSAEELLASGRPRRRARWYTSIGNQVLISIVLGIAVGALFPAFSAQLGVVGDTFLDLIKIGVAPLVFLTVVMGIAAAGDLKKASRTGLIALIYFEVVSTVALLLGLLAGNVSGVGIGTGALSGAHPTGGAPTGGSDDEGFLATVVPDNFVGAFSSGHLLQVVVIAVLLGIGLLTLAPAVQARFTAGLETASEGFFALINVIMRLAPIGTFGAIAYSVGTNGPAMLLALAELVAQYWIVVVLFIVVVLGGICLAAGINVFRLLRAVRTELTLVLGTASSEAGLPGLLEKLPRMGLSRQTVGLVMPTGYAFNLDGTSIYLALCTLFLANAYGIPMGFEQQLGLLVIMLLTSKGAATVSGGTFVVFASTVTATGYLPVEGVAILFGVYRVMSMATATCNTFGNVVATAVISRWNGDLDRARLRAVLADPSLLDQDDDAPKADPAANVPTTPANSRSAR